MSNILDDILGSMEPPPAQSEEQRRLHREAMEAAKIEQAREKETLKKYKSMVEEKLQEFVKSQKDSFEFEPAEKVFRNILYDAVEVAGLMACSFGIEGVDRYSVVYNKDRGPSEDEKTVRNNGGKWDQDVAQKMALERAQREQESKEEIETVEKFVPTGTLYTDKYPKINLAPEKTTSNMSYGEVPSTLKRDKRSIEETLETIKSKRQKIVEEEVSSSTDKNAVPQEQGKQKDIKVTINAESDDEEPLVITISDSDEYDY